MSSSAVNLLNRHRQDDISDEEAGGVLLGRLILGGEDIIVDEATQPTSKDKRGRFRFLRARSPTQRLINRAWKQSQATRVYLGEWHTHPELCPMPSHIDWQNWEAILRNARRVEYDSLYFLIMGTVSVRIWEGWRSDLSLVELQQDTMAGPNPPGLIT